MIILGLMSIVIGMLVARHSLKYKVDEGGASIFAMIGAVGIVLGASVIIYD